MSKNIFPILRCYLLCLTDLLWSLTRHSKIIGEKQGRRVRNGQHPGHETRVSGVKGDQLLLEKIFTSV